MLNQAIAVALRISLFRAGPQDFPYSPALTRLIVPLTLFAAFLQYRLTLPGMQAALHAVAWVGALAAFTYVMLQSRGVLNRLRQTLDSLFLIGAVMTLAMLAPLAAIAPHMARIAENPDLARTEPLPPLPALIVIAVSLWNFLITAHIYRHALNTLPGIGAVVALLSAVVTVSLASAVGMLLG
jgi:hypothetical protein